MKYVYALIALLMLAGCSALPVIKSAPGTQMACPRVFVEQSTRFIHAIEARAAGRTQAVMIGVTLVNPGERSISCAIVSPEGLSLFEAASVADEINVSRALPPFDKPDFAQNMMEDVRLIFLQPPGAPRAQGLLADGRPVCRWSLEKGGWVDVSGGATEDVRIMRYSENGRIQRRATLAAGKSHIYQTVELQAEGLIDYTLVMTLLESEGVSENAKDAPPANGTTEGHIP